ncbi:hypothetical protein WJ59_24770 [Burkholderia gladioli]|uniref:hypothetical protein n=1 Tax=Burkholderia gladioli TaxID=28095 RepID=UPI000755AAD3|nr:hypothetical protein [Burkholderia gladioli]KVM62702.1 hypothetical protein WJ59_24770 [Burkholderia gladioli]
MRVIRSTALLAGSLLTLTLAAGAQAQTPAAAPATSASQPVLPVIATIAPIYNQLVYFRLPTRFVSIYEGTRGDDYAHEWVLPGETNANWSQMITLTGAQNVIAKHPEADAKSYATGIAAGFQKACPQSFSAKGIYDGKLNGSDAFSMVVSCGNAAASAGHSETTAITVVKGAKDLYTLQWAQRGPLSTKPLDIDAAMWLQRVRNLMPLKVCPIVPGEKAPYPSCSANVS